MAELKIRSIYTFDSTKEPVIKCTIIIICCLILVHGNSTAERAEPANNFGTPGDNRDPDLDDVNRIDDDFTLDPNTEDSLVIIYYGLNESHSKDWVREDANGVIGISYFQRFEDDEIDGTLIYKTIQPNGLSISDSVATGTRLEKSVLLFDSLSNPHIFVAQSNDLNQWIEHYYKDSGGLWRNDIVYNFYSMGGKFIYEISADSGPDGSFHLLLLKSRSDIDSDDYWDAWINSYLYHLTNSTGSWQIELIYNYDMPYTYDHHIKSSSRQDMQIDKNGYVHVIFGEQINGNGYPDPSRLMYATNKSGNWAIETALNPDQGTRDEAGWMASLCLDSSDIPYVSCMYKKRVVTGSAVYCRLLLLKRLDQNNWSVEVVAAYDDGYFGGDGRTFTGALSHLVSDIDNRPHIIFSDVASAHWGMGGTNRLSLGNIRYGVFDDGVWNIGTIYRQPSPTSFYRGFEMHGMCLVVSNLADSIRIIGQELEITAAFHYTSNLLSFSLPVTAVPGNSLPREYSLSQNYPNPFNPVTTIEYIIPTRLHVTLEVYNILGQKIRTLVDELKSAGDFQTTWDGKNANGVTVSSGIYFYRFRAEDFVETKKMIFLK